MINFEDLREWQKKAYMKWVMNGNTGILLGCTGSGKSVAALYCIQQVKATTIIIVPTIALMNQWREEIVKHLNIQFEEVGVIGDGNNSPKQITIAVVNSVRGMDLSYFEMIVLDEAHRYGSIENILPLMNNKFDNKLGLTATLKRADGKDADLEELIGKVVYTYTTEEAVKDGVLSEFSIVNVGIDLDVYDLDNYNAYTETINKDSFSDMYNVMKDSSNPNFVKACRAVRATAKRKAIISNAEGKIKELVNIVKENKDKKIIVFNETIKMAEKERKALKKEGFECEIYHSKTKKQEAIERFRNNEVKILISVKSLNEGLDVKDVDVMIRVAGTNQDRDTIQRLGRGLRVVDGKTDATYYQIYCKDTLEKWQITKNTNVIKSASEKVTWR